MNQLAGFDPILFLEIKNLKSEERNGVSEKLIQEISEYLAIRTAELLSENSLEQINDPLELYSLAEKDIPGFKDKVKEFLEDFKTEFNKNISK